MAILDPLNPIIESYRERVSDPGYPYFYKARPTKKPYILRNPLLGKLASLQVMFPARVARSLVSGVRGLKKGPGPSPHYDLLLKETSKGTLYIEPWWKMTEFQEFHSAEPPTVEDLRNKIAIWLWNPYAVQQGGGVPYITFDFPPKELEFNVASELKSVGIIGLNYPEYHYVGSQETLTIEVEWYDDPRHEDRVITKCRKVEALSKADGYRSGPKQIYVDWGVPRLNNPSLAKVLDDTNIYTIQSANFKLTNFMLKRTDRGSTYSNNFNALLAKQTIILKREDRQLTSEKIIYGSLR